MHILPFPELWKYSARLVLLPCSYSREYESDIRICALQSSYMVPNFPARCPQLSVRREKNICLTFPRRSPEKGRFGSLGWQTKTNIKISTLKLWIVNLSLIFTEFHFHQFYFDLLHQQSSWPPVTKWTSCSTSRTHSTPETLHSASRRRRKSG